MSTFDRAEYVSGGEAVIHEGFIRRRARAARRAWMVRDRRIMTSVYAFTLCAIGGTCVAIGAVTLVGVEAERTDGWRPAQCNVLQVSFVNDTSLCVYLELRVAGGNTTLCGLLAPPPLSTSSALHDAPACGPVVERASDATYWLAQSNVLPRTVQCIVPRGGNAVLYETCWSAATRAGVTAHFYRFASSADTFAYVVRNDADAQRAAEAATLTKYHVGSGLALLGGALVAASVVLLTQRFFMATMHSCRRRQDAADERKRHARKSDKVY